MNSIRSVNRPISSAPVQPAAEPAPAAEATAGAASPPAAAVTSDGFSAARPASAPAESADSVLATHLLIRGRRLTAADWNLAERIRNMPVPDALLRFGQPQDPGPAGEGPTAVPEGEEVPRPDGPEQER